MKSSIKLFIFLFFFLLKGFIFGQQKQINSLKEKLKQTDLNDSLRVKYLGDIGWYFSGFAPDSAFKYCKLALSLSKKNNYSSGIAQAYNDIGIVHYRIAQFDSSLVYYRKALPIRIKNKDTLGIASLYNKMGISHNQLFKLDSAIYYTLESLKIYEILNLKKNVAVTLNNIANLYRDTKQYDKAIEKHREALAIRKKLKDEFGMAQSFIGIGNINIFLAKNDSAKVYYKKGIKIGEKLGLARELSTAYNNLGNIYKEEDDFSKAKEYFTKALNIRKQIKDNYGIASTLLNLGDLNLKTKNYTTANRLLHQSLQLSTKMKSDELTQNIFREFIEVKAYLKQPDSVTIYKNLYLEYQDLNLNNKITKQLSELETKYETEKKEKEILAQREQLLAQELKLKNRNLYATLITAALLILAIIFFSIYKRNQLKREQLEKEIDLKDALAKIKTQNRLQEQRLRISRDLHDNIGSQLTFIISSIDNLKFISKDANEKLKSKLATISSFTGDTIHQLRDTIWAMNKSEISIEDLHSRILSYIEKAKIAVPEVKIDVNYDIDKNKSFSSLIGMNIFRTLQEAINNAIKYSESNTIEITLKNKKNNFVATVTDFGKGFAINSVELGNGLSNMEKRMSEIGGTIKITSEEKKGTTIQLEVQLENTTNDV